jgi:hypothetical protein
MIQLIVDPILLAEFECFVTARPCNLSAGYILILNPITSNVLYSEDVRHPQGTLRTPSS